MKKNNNKAQVDWLGKRFADGKISRREFIGRTAALGMTTALATTLAGNISAIFNLPIVSA